MTPAPIASGRALARPHPARSSICRPPCATSPRSPRCWVAPRRRWPCPRRRAPSSRPASAGSPSAGRSCWPSRPRPTPSGWPTTSAAYLGDDAVELFPAWETLPFERVSPGVETMGRRLRVAVAPARPRPRARRRRGARCGRWCSASAPTSTTSSPIVDPARRRSVDRDELVARPGRRRLPARVAGRAPRRGGRAGLDRRRVPVDRRPARPHRPVGRRGRPPDRVLGRRPALHRRPRPRSRSSRAASCCPPTRCARGPSGWSASSRGAASSGSGWPRACVFDGMESWLPWLTERRARAARPRRRRRPGAAVRAPPHARPGRRPAGRGGRPGRHPGGTWGADGRPRAAPRLPPPAPRRSTGSSPTPRRRPGTSSPRPTAPTRPPVQALGVGPGGRRRHRAAGQRLATLQRDGYRIVVGGRRRGLGRPPRATCCAAEGVDGRGRAWPPLERGCVLPGGQAGGAGRGRPHRPPPRPPRGPAPRRDAEGFFDDLKPGDYVVHHQHGVARYGGMVKRAIGGVERDYLLLEYRGDDKLYVPSDQIDAVRHYTGGDSPSLSRLGGDELAADQGQGAGRGGRDRPGAGGALPEAAATRPGHAFPPDTPWQRELEEAFPYQETPDQLKAIADVKADMEDADADGPPGVRRRRLRQDRGGHPGRVQGGAGRQAGGGARAHHAAGPAALPDLQRPLRRLPGAGRGAVAASSPPGQARKVAEGVAQRRGRLVIGTHRLLSRGHHVQGPRPARRRRGAALRRQPQGADQAAARPTSTCSR